jgi:hypothetical protein
MTDSGEEDFGPIELALRQRFWAQIKSYGPIFDSMFDDQGGTSAPKEPVVIAEFKGEDAALFHLQVTLMTNLFWLARQLDDMNASRDG